MNPAFKTLLLLFAFVITAPEVAAEEWRGLTPLYSMRSDVVRLFGECNNEEAYCVFTVDNEDIYITFSQAATCDTVPMDSILTIERELRSATTFAALGLDKRRFESFNPAAPANLGYRGFIDEESGLLLKTFNGAVFQINYIPPKKEWERCRIYYRNPRQLVAVYLPHVMVVNSLKCPETSPIAGEKVEIVASYQRTGQRLLVTWNTSAGRIIQGDGSRKIVFDTSGLEGKKILVTAELNDGRQHTATGTCAFEVARSKKN